MSEIIIHPDKVSSEILEDRFCKWTYYHPFSEDLDFHLLTLALNKYIKSINGRAGSDVTILGWDYDPQKPSMVCVEFMLLHEHETRKMFALQNGFSKYAVNSEDVWKTEKWSNKRHSSQMVLFAACFLQLVNLNFLKFFPDINFLEWTYMFLSGMAIFEILYFLYFTIRINFKKK